MKQQLVMWAAVLCVAACVTVLSQCGWASTWGYELFHDDWQEAMARHAAKLKGVKWVD